MDDIINSAGCIYAVSSHGQNRYGANGCGEDEYYASVDHHPDGIYSNMYRAVYFWEICIGG